jgi:hypothetical protein
LKINQLYFAIKVFNFFYAAYENISMEDAKTPREKDFAILAALPSQFTF